jgi:hypothetical protein
VGHFFNGGASMLVALTLIHSAGREDVKYPTPTVPRLPSLTRPKSSNPAIRRWSDASPSDDFRPSSGSPARFYGSDSARGTRKVLFANPSGAAITIDGLDHQNFLIPVGMTAMRIAAWPMVAVIPRAPTANITLIASNGSLVATFDRNAGDFGVFFASEPGWISIETSQPTSLEYYSIPLWPWNCSSVYLSTSPSETFIGSGTNAAFSGGNFSIDEDERACFVHVSDSMTQIVTQFSLQPDSDFLSLRSCDWARDISYSGMEDHFVARRLRFLGMQWKSSGLGGSGGFAVSIDSPKSSLPERRARVTTSAESVQVLRHPDAVLGAGTNESSRALAGWAIALIVIGCILFAVGVFGKVWYIKYACPLRPPSAPPRGVEKLYLGTFILYHQTSHTAAHVIVSSQTMYAGRGGFFGPGIYFGRTADDTSKLGGGGGVILRARVDLGRALILSSSAGSMNLNTLRSADCQSVWGHAGNRPWEFVVYSSAQVTNIRYNDGSYLPL